MRGSRHPRTIMVVIMIMIMIMIVMVIVSGICSGQRQIVLGVRSGQR